MWILCYHGKSTFTSDDGPWQDAPAWGVMSVIHSDDTVGYSRNTGDFYILPPWSDGEPWAVDHWGLMDYLLQLQALDPDEKLTSKTAEFLEAAGVKFGRTIATRDWQEHLAWMNTLRLPVKSARYAHERP